LFPFNLLFTSKILKIHVSGLPKIYAGMNPSTSLRAGTEFAGCLCGGNLFSASTFSSATNLTLLINKSFLLGWGNYRRSEGRVKGKEGFGGSRVQGFRGSRKMGFKGMKS
jgi:hypothetical protein